MVILCQLKELGLSCFGCCNTEDYNKKKIMKGIKKNTYEFNKSKSLRLFMSRTKKLRPSGICANIVFKDGKFFCPGHPELHNGNDYRELDKDCERDAYDGCKVFMLFQKWDKEKQEQFIGLIKSKNLDSYTYSIRMNNNSLLKEFEKRLKNSGERTFSGIQCG